MDLQEEEYLCFTRVRTFFFFFFHSPIRKSVLLVSLGGLRTICPKSECGLKNKKETQSKKRKSKEEEEEEETAFAVC